jgi:hypothetical protein
MTKTFAVLAFSAALPALAQAPKPVNEFNMVQVTGTIEAIKPETREVTIKVDGQLHSFTVEKDVKRFNELKVGDKLTASYHEAVLMEVRKPGAEKPKAEGGGETMRVPGKGASPSGALLKQRVATFEIKAIDKAIPAVTVLNEDGETVKMKVQHPERLEGVKVGDKIDVTYTEAVILQIN